MILFDLARPRQILRLLTRPPRDPSRWACRVQLFRDFPFPMTPAPKLHRAGYRATPDRIAPLCSDGPGPYGRPVWVPVGREPYPCCSDCEVRFESLPRDADQPSGDPVR